MHPMFALSAILLSASPLAVGPSLFPASAADVFRAHQAAILEPGTHRFDGFVFATVREPFGRLGQSAASDRASMRAAERFLVEAAGDPARCVDEPLLKKQLEAAAAVSRKVSFDASGIETVHQARQGDAVLVVRALPAERLAGLEIPCDRVIGSVCDLATTGEPPLALVCLALEVAPDPRKAQLETATRAALEREHPGVTKTDRVPWRELPTGFVVENKPPANADAGTALTYATSRPGDPEAAMFARDALTRAGYTRAAGLVAVPASAMPVPLAAGLRDGLRGELRSLLEREAELRPASAWLLLLSAYGTGLPLPGPGSALSPAAQEAFRAKRLAACVVAALPAETPGADAWNMTSVCVRELGAPMLALEASRLAQRLDPSHPYAPVNELLALKAIGDRCDVALRLIEVESLPHLNDWSRNRIGELKQWLVGSSAAAAGPS
jgi:hypothetical protein